MKIYPKEFLAGLLRTMVTIRLCEERLVEPILNGDVKTPCHLYSGEEAVAAGICSALLRSDYVFGTHRSHGHYLAKGCKLKELVAEIYGKRTGCSGGRGGSMHVTDPDLGVAGAAPIVAGTIPLAVGASLASKIRDDKRVTVSFFGDGATGEGVLFESLNFAALKKLPIIFVCENNLYSTHMPIGECRPDVPIVEIGKTFGMVSYRVDGNDVLAVHEIAKEAVEFCRKGEGPVFVECLTYRLRGHVGPDDNVQGTHTDIRPPEEIEEWKSKDPILRFEKYLTENKVLLEMEVVEIKKEAEKATEEAFAFAVNSPYPDESELEACVFRERGQ
jgi:acetoin:2,6-dichlorophenolindophenol oxidoreductase subunit alpha